MKPLAPYPPQCMSPKTLSAKGWHWWGPRVGAQLSLFLAPGE